jgi:hypothetical protein
VTRRVHHDDDVDIDLVATRDLAKESTTQLDLKRDAGQAIRTYADSCIPRPKVAESDRCWTLTFAGMHMDVLPSLTDRDRLNGLLITDRSVRAWQHSDPQGYSQWFLSQMTDELNELRAEFAKNTDVEEVPVFQVRSVLQRVIQALKRHRDIYFQDRLDDRPASVIITTLAALAYANSGATDLYDSLRTITRSLPAFINYGSTGWYLPNPVQAEENFADYWNIDADLPRNFEEWAQAASQDFEAIGSLSGMHNILPRLGQTFGERAQVNAANAAGNGLHKARTSGELVATPAAPSVAPRTVKNHGFAGGAV